MPIQLKMPVPGGEMTITGDNQKSIFKQAAFWQGLPTKCPIDGSPTRLEFRNPQDYEYFMLVSTGEFPYEFKLGIHNNADQTLFSKGKWTYYNNEKREEVTVWEYGQINEANLPRAGASARPSPSTTSNPSPDDYQGQAPIDPPPRNERDEQLKKGQLYAVKMLNKAGIPEKMRGPVLTAMLNRPIQNDMSKLTLSDAKQLKQYLDNVPEGIQNAWSEVQSSDPEAAAADGSDLDFDGFDDDKDFH